MPSDQVARDRALRIVSVAAGGLSAALGGIVVLGWITGSVRLIQTHPAFPPMQYNTALGFLFCGVGLMAALSGRPRVALGGGAIAVALGGLAIVQHLFHIDTGIDRLLMIPVVTTLTEHPGRIPPNSAFCLVLGGAAILVLRRPEGGSRRPPVLGILGTILIAVGLVAYLGYLADLPQAHGWGRLAHMSVPSAVGFVVLGTGVMAAAWREDRGDEPGAPVWLPIPVGLGLATVVVCLWRALAAQAAGRPSALPTVTLVAGLGLSALVAGTLRLFQTARLRTREAEVANRELLDEITDHRRTMDQLAQHASKLELSLNTMKTEARIILSILNSMGDGVVVTDPEGKILLFNPEAERLAGLGATDAPSGAWPAVCGFYRADQSTPFPAEDLPFAKALRGESVDGVEVFVRGPHLPGGCWVNLGGWPLRDARGAMQGAVIVLRDVSSYKASERMKDEFVSVVSHELRTPLTAIKGALGLLIGGVTGGLPERARSMLDVADRNSNRLMHLINDILDIQKIEAGRMEFKREPVDLQRAVEQAAEAHRDYATSVGVVVELIRSHPGARVLADADRVGQVLANFLSNAIKFSPPKGRVEVSVERVDGAIRVSVADHGPGVPESFRKRIFQKFAQADATDARQKGGTGLGLSISKAIVERLGGRIGFESEPGVRTVFHFDLSEAPVEAASTPSSSAGPPPA
jgi:signal transduction histidine kinase/ABC-type transport system involved in cytochrome c biogenesis permease subunit